MGKIKTILTCLLGMVLAASAKAQSASAAASAEPSRAVVIVIDDQINEYTAKTMEKRIEQARRMGAKTIVLQLDTPGGLVSSAIDMSRYLRNLEDVHTIAFVSPRAYSAGSMIAVSCDEIWMAKGSVIGDCGVIRISGDELVPISEHDRSKFDSPVVADFLASAQRNHYDPLLLQSFVLIHHPVYYIANDAGEKRFVDDQQYHSLTSQGWHDVPGVQEPVNRADTFLTLYSSQAVAIGLAKGEVSNTAELAKAANLNIITTLQTTWGERALDLLNTGVGRGLILCLFLIFLYVALHTPGHGVAEVLSLVFFCMLVGVPLLTGYATWWEIALIMVGILFLAMEIFVFPTVGIMAFGGVALMFLGLLLTFIAPEPGRSPLSIPKMPATWASLENGLLVIVLGLASAFIACAWIRRFLPKLPYFNRLILTTTVGGSDAAMVGSLTNIDPISTRPAIGAIGMAVTDLRPGGSAEFKDAAGGSHVVSVVSDSGYLGLGSPIVVKSLSGPTIIVGTHAAAGEKRGMLTLGDRKIEPLPVQIGAVGIATSDLRPGGTCEFDGRRLETFSIDGMIPAGTNVKVVSIDNRRPLVRPV